MGTAEVQGPLWGAKAHDWAELQEPAWRPLYEEVLRRAGAGPGVRVLDVGCGAGGALLVASAMGAEPVGLDAAEALIAIARRRLPGARLDVGEIEALPFADAGFDLVTGFNAFQFAGDVVRALAESRRVCRPGGLVVMLVWGPPESCDIPSRIVPAVVALLPPAPPPRQPTVAFGAPGVVEDLMRQAGLLPAASVETACAFTYPDLATAMRAIASSAPVIRAERHAGDAAVRAAIEQALRPFVLDDGTVRLQNRFRYVIATRVERA
jgi:SAM-dependent methyltransferase